MTIYYGDKTNYGEVLGILMMDSSFPRIPGDIGNATTFDYPVHYEVVKGANIARVVENPDKAILKIMIEKAKKMESIGIRAITGSCGFLAIWQKEIAEAVDIPVFTSSLLQVPFASIFTGNKPVGIITAQKRNLTDKHFSSVGADGIPKFIYGLEDADEFNKTFTDGGSSLDFDKVENEILDKALLMQKEHPEIKSIVLECTNIPPYSYKISKKLGIPVFDTITLCNYVYSAIIRKKYKGWL